MTATHQDANSILMGGGGAPAAKLTEGVTVAGRIVHITEPYQEREYDPNNPGNGALKFFKSGNPIMTFAIDVATDQRDPSIEDDDGTRRIYMDGKRIKDAVRDGVRAARAQGLTVGSQIAITCTHYDTPGDVRSGKNYRVQYVPGSPADAVLMGQQEQPPAPAPAANPFAGAPQWAQPQQQAPAQPAQQWPPAPQQQAAPAPAPTPAAPAPAAAPQQFTPAQVAAMQAAGIDPSTLGLG